MFEARINSDSTPEKSNDFIDLSIENRNNMEINNPKQIYCKFRLVPSRITNLPNIGDLLWRLYI